MEIKSWGRLIACPSPTKQVGKTNRPCNRPSVASAAAENEKSSTQQGNMPPDAEFAMQKTPTSEPEDRMQTGTANRVRSKFRRDVREKKRRRNPLTRGKRVMYYRSTLGEGDSLSKPLRTVLSTIFVLGLALPQRLSSQAVYGSIVGTVLDAT